MDETKPTLTPIHTWSLDATTKLSRYAKCGTALGDMCAALQQFCAPSPPQAPAGDPLPEAAAGAEADPAVSGNGCPATIRCCREEEQSNKQSFFDKYVTPSAFAFMRSTGFV
jgi:hypothetical protein